MNCGTCIAFLRIKRPCPGCRFKDLDTKPKHCISCTIKNCEYLAQTKSGFCYECSNFPCPRMKNLDKRYRRNYHMSLIENLTNIQNQGLPDFIKEEKIRWKCKLCGSILCVHRERCLNCGTNLPE
ncbi:MAG: DUF3795 domain-containing protein [Bacteroidales bacterium]|nr:DUF3795 domain-containing protein [Bacteroidales bacterium]